MFLNWQVLLVSVGSSRFFKLKALECSGRFVKVLEGSCRFCRFLKGFRMFCIFLRFLHRVRGSSFKFLQVLYSVLSVL